MITSEFIKELHCPSCNGKLMMYGNVCGEEDFSISLVCKRCGVHISSPLLPSQEYWVVHNEIVGNDNIVEDVFLWNQA